MKSNEDTDFKYFEGHEVVWAVKYCTGKSGKYIWHIANLYKTENECNVHRDLLLDRVNKLKSEYLSIFGKKFKPCSNKKYKNYTSDEIRYILINQDILKVNVVSTPYRIENTNEPNAN